jgi:hypothetical protein
LRRWVDGVKANSDFTLQVPAYGLIGQHRGRICPFLIGPKVVVASAIRMGAERLHGVGTAVYELLIVRDDLWGRFQFHGDKRSPPLVPFPL